MVGVRPKTSYYFYYMHRRTVVRSDSTKTAISKRLHDWRGYLAFHVLPGAKKENILHERSKAT
jgi:hypothetical protein